MSRHRKNSRKPAFSARLFADGQPVHSIKATSFEDLQRKVREIGRIKFR